MGVYGIDKFLSHLPTSRLGLMSLSHNGFTSFIFGQEMYQLTCIGEMHGRLFKCSGRQRHDFLKTSSSISATVRAYACQLPTVKSKHFCAPSPPTQSTCWRRAWRET